MTEQFKRLLTRAANFFMHPRRPGLHLFVHPVTAALAVDDANAFADCVENQVRLLGDQRALQRQKIGGV